VINVFLSNKSIFFLPEIIPNAEYNLTNKLFQYYSNDIRPVKNWNDTLVVTLSLFVIKVADVIESNQNMILHVKLQFSWAGLFLLCKKTTDSFIINFYIFSRMISI
jgi:hypothetical protein